MSILKNWESHGKKWIEAKNGSGDLAYEINAPRSFWVFSCKKLFLILSLCIAINFRINFLEAMLSFSQLIKSVPKAYISELTLSEDGEIDFDCRNACYIIKKGELLSYGKNKFTQLLNASDPIGVAETILGRPNELKYRRHKKVELYCLAGDPVRRQINNAGPLAKSIIKYSLRRIFKPLMMIRRLYFLKKNFS